jgi:hypothetical protein
VNAQNNPYEAAARASKLSKLLDAADEMATERGEHPRRDAAAIAARWIDATVDDFAALLTRSKVRAPSATTWAAFLEALQHRADVRAS